MASCGKFQWEKLQVHTQLDAVWDDEPLGPVIAYCDRPLLIDRWPIASNQPKDAS